MAEQTVSTTLYCISVLGQNNPIEQLSEGLAKQFIKLDVIPVLNKFRPLSVLVFPLRDFQRVHEMLTNILNAAGINNYITFWMTTWGNMCRGNDFPSTTAIKVPLRKSLNK